MTMKGQTRPTVTTITLLLMAIAITSAVAFTSSSANLRSPPIIGMQSPICPISTSSCLCAYRERSGGRYDSHPSGSGKKQINQRSRTSADYGNEEDAFGDYDVESFGGFDYFEDDDDYGSHDHYNSQQNVNGASQSITTTTSPTAQSSTFYSQKSLDDPSFSIPSTNRDQDQQFFRKLCQAAKITQPSRIQSLAWPPMLRGENTIVADQTGSGKTLAYLLPLLQKLHQLDMEEESSSEGGNTLRKKKRTGSPRIVVLTPTAELADQIHAVATSLSKELARFNDSRGWTFNPFVTTATGSHSTNIRDQIRLLQSTPVDVLISTPGRLSTILRTKSAKLNLGGVVSLVLDEVDFLLVDETFGPQLRTVGVAVNSGGDSAPADDNDGPQFVFVTATLPEDVLSSIQSEFPNVTQLRGPGLHRVGNRVQQTLVDVSVPSTSNRDSRACFDIKVRELNKALRGRRCARTLVFCNTVETCRNVENVLRRKDRGGKRTRVWSYHGALSHEARVRNLAAFSSGGSGSGSRGQSRGRQNNNDDGDGGTERILVCTDRAARGIDFDASPIDHVLLFDFPKDPAEYVRRVGRTARAGRAGASTVLAYGWQLPIARKIMGLSSAKGKGKNAKKGNAKLESFTMMKSTDGWDDMDKEDEYYIKGGARKRKETAGRNGARGGGSDVTEKKAKRKGGGKPKMWNK